MNLLLKRPLEFALYEHLNSQTKISERFGYNSSSYFMNGAIAASFGALLGCPFSVLKLKVQSSPGLSVRQAFWDVLEIPQQGTSKASSSGMSSLRSLPTLWRGLHLQFSFSVPAASIYLGFYGKTREALLVDKSDGFIVSPGVAGGVAGVAASCLMWTVMMPVDAVKTKVQAQGMTVLLVHATNNVEYLHSD